MSVEYLAEARVKRLWKRIGELYVLVDQAEADGDEALLAKYRRETDEALREVDQARLDAAAARGET